MISNELILAAGAGANPLLPNPWEILVTAAGFAVLLFIVVKYIAPAFEKSYQDRVTAIEGGLEKAEAAQAEANATLEQYKAQLLEARTEANRIREEAREEGAQILAELKTKAAEESARITEQAHRQIESERVAAVTSLRAEVGTLATSLASKIVDDALENDDRASRVVDKFLADLENQQNAGASN
ncbi:F0F1 ATP synthase subunit B [Paeniglutamicibacter psychrophenolicus]|uniref:ATP synthase subunit b n=1 Tax=Paeniglutamicibacter psychrophenolicus TaxID=257454 RepID=A0ABS4WFB0_9MICC|nr:F0F1 ATP synthase subunit B [Paeniglutamicibacter psychrophenolicus]MBP2374259.1 F-type H+-transporting ATPase subunit b [Paeniglutamicibacter psychrophenolicus]